MAERRIQNFIGCSKRQSSANSPVIGSVVTQKKRRELLLTSDCYWPLWLLGFIWQIMIGQVRCHLKPETPRRNWRRDGGLQKTKTSFCGSLSWSGLNIFAAVDLLEQQAGRRSCEGLTTLTSFQFTSFTIWADADQDDLRREQQPRLTLVPVDRMMNITCSSASLLSVRCETPDCRPDDDDDGRWNHWQRQDNRGCSDPRSRSVLRPLKTLLVVFGRRISWLPAPCWRRDEAASVITSLFPIKSSFLQDCF